MENEKVSLPCPPPVLQLGAGFPPSCRDWEAGPLFSLMVTSQKNGAQVLEEDSPG